MGVRKTNLSTTRILSAVALAAGISVLIVSGAVTVAISSGAGEVLRAPFHLICHGQLDRAFELAGVAMPICARCTGIYAGIALGALLMMIAPLERRRSLLFLAGVLLAAPLVVDGSMQTLGLWSTGNLPRGMTGLLFGVGLITLAGNGVAGRPFVPQPQ